jgi:acyl dehydratase
MIYLDDMKAGDKAVLGPVTVDREEALEFARRYDPQPFHLDEAAAAAHPFFGRLAISGWQTCALAMRLMVQEIQALGIQSLGSPGIDQIRWLKPVHPGDKLTLEVETLEVKPSRSRPEMGSAKRAYVFRNQHGEPVMTMEASALFLRRPPSRHDPM